MTTDNFCFYLQNGLIQTSQTGGQQYSDTSHFSITCFSTSGGQNSNIYLNVVQFLTTVLIRHLWQLKTDTFLHRCQWHVVLLELNEVSSEKVERINIL